MFYDGFEMSFTACMLMIGLSLFSWAMGKRAMAMLSLNSQRGLEYLTKGELAESLSRLPPNVRVLLASEACYSGYSITITSDAGASHEMFDWDDSNSGGKVV